MPSVQMVNGTSAQESTPTTGMPLTEYTANPSPTEKTTILSSVPTEYLLQDGYPDVIFNALS